MWCVRVRGSILHAGVIKGAPLIGTPEGPWVGCHLEGAMPGVVAPPFAAPTSKTLSGRACRARAGGSFLSVRVRTCLENLSTVPSPSGRSAAPKGGSPCALPWSPPQRPRRPGTELVVRPSPLRLTTRQSAWPPQLSCRLPFSWSVEAVDGDVGCLSSLLGFCPCAAHDCENNACRSTQCTLRNGRWVPSKVLPD